MKSSVKYVYDFQKELSVLKEIEALLSWDQMTFMPPRGVRRRAEQFSLISKISHEKIISDKLWKHIENLTRPSVFDKLNDADRAVVKRLRSDVEKARKIPVDYIERLSKTTTLAYSAWERARNKDDFSIFRPHLENVVELQKEFCRYIDLPGSSYNSLLDNYEEGMTVEKLEKEFSYLKSELIKIFSRIKDSERFKEKFVFDKNLEKNKQRELCGIFLKKIGLPSDSTRLDVSTHSFTISIGDRDVRITTSFKHEKPLFSFFSTVHEAGHALYELGLPKGKFRDTVISEAASLGLHESQSRFWENMIARSKNFWSYFLRFFKNSFPAQFKNVNVEKWYKTVNQVQPSCVRVEADELTYCLHVILRFELEHLLIEDKINVSDLPVLWDEKMQDMLDVKPRSNKEGVLQDMHWSNGSFGYFPTYAIGTVYASQIYNKIKKEHPLMDEDIKKGEFNNITRWLQEDIHRFGRLMTAEEIIKNACGEGLNSKTFLNYLKNKYFSMYEV